MKIHDEIDDWTAGALCGVLSPEEQQNFEQHLAECPHCRSLYEENQKMNTILNETLPELRPDQNFERRIIARFREKVSRGGFHPLRGLVWLMQFRAAQAAFTILLLAALVKVGAVITKERFPRDGGLAVNTKAFNALSDVDNAHFWNPYKTDSEAKQNGDESSTSGAETASPARTEVQKLKTLFADADSFYSTGRYDLAYKRSEQILNIDPYNVAARKMEEKINSAKDRYAVESYNNTRGQWLYNVQKGWNPPERKYQGREVVKIDTGKAGVTDSSGLLTKNGNGTLTLSGTNSYTGGTTLNGGTLTFGGATANFSAGETVAAAGTTNGDVNAVSLATDRRSDSNLNLGDIPLAGHLFAENGKSIQDGRIIKDHHFSPVAQTKIPAEQTVDTHKLIRNAALEIEVEYFENALETITTVAGEEQGYVNTQNSERGANGKLQGEIVVKILPANLDRFLLKLRALGEMKNQTLGTEDVTKAYFDTDARIRNSKRTEEQLLDILKKNTNRVSDLLQVEKELARVREQIEQMQGQLKYYDALVAYATVTISLREKDLSQAAAYLLKEHANLSLFAKDVEKAFADAKGAAETAKAQTVESHIERDGDGRVTATLHLLFAPEVSDETISKLKTLGRIQNFNSQTQRVARGGSGNSDVAKIERDKVELNLTIQRDEETAAQQTGISVLTDRVEEKTAQIKQAAAKAGVEVKNAAFNRTANDEEVASLILRMPMQKYAAFLGEIKSLGKVKDFTVSRRENADVENAPVEIALQIFNQGNVVPDESGLFATVRKTLGEGFGALMWSARMIGVSLAFIAPWGISLGLIVWLVIRRRGAKKL